jgi:hypothetical protein
MKLSEIQKLAEQVRDREIVNCDDVNLAEATLKLVELIDVLSEMRWVNSENISAVVGFQSRIIGIEIDEVSGS